MGNLLDEIAAHKKQHFLKLVEGFARFRDVQYGDDSTEKILNLAKTVIEGNLPSNLLRAAIIFVDRIHGFPPDGSSFCEPEWVRATQLLPEVKRGILYCSEFKKIASVNEGDAVVLAHDFPSSGLIAGMAGIVREKLSEDEDGTPELLLVEFGEPEENLTEKIEVPVSFLRTPRPGDMLENFRF